jgi:hypothetical protein
MSKTTQIQMWEELTQVFLEAGWEIEIQELILNPPFERVLSISTHPYNKIEQLLPYYECA